MATPVVAGETVVAVVLARRNELDIVGLDRVTGKELWRHPFLATSNLQGEYLGALTYRSDAGDAYVVFQHAPSGRALVMGAPQPYVAIDPTSGKVLARTKPVRTTYGPVPCDDGNDVCLRIGASVSDETRWVLGTWGLRPEPNRLPIGANTLAEGSQVYGVFDDGGASDYLGTIGRFGRLHWRLRAQRLIGPGWKITYEGARVHQESGVAVLGVDRMITAAQIRRYESGRPVALDQSVRRMIALDIETGTVVWRHGGADFQCLELARTELPVRCAFKGQVVARQGREQREMRNLRLALEGYDPVTGETTWSHPLLPRTARRAILGQGDYGATTDEVYGSQDFQVIATAEGPVLLSLVDGSTRRIEDGEAVICANQVKFRYVLDQLTIQGFLTETRERYLRRLCRTDGKATNARIGVAGLMTGAVDVGDGTWVLAEAGRVVAYRVS